MEALCQVAAAEDATKQFAARTELWPIQTLTLSDQQFLTGDNNGKLTAIAGQLRIAQGSGCLPVVVLQHSSGGFLANIEFWSRELNAAGISTFALDGFTGRGLTEVNSNQALLGRLNFILDIYRALDVLAVHPRVDPRRIAVMGFSRGGQAALYASLKRFHQTWNKSGMEFVAYLSFYPDCMTTYIADTAVERDVWYWTMVTKSGQTVPKKVTTDQLKTLIKAGHLDAEAQISKTLKISKRTVDEHSQTAARKLGASNRTQAVAIAMRNRMIEV